MPPFSSIQIEAPQWGIISWALNSKQCILILGPQFHKDPDGRPLRQLLANEMADELGDAATFNRNDIAYVSKLYEKIKGNLSLKMKVTNFYGRHTLSSELAKAVTKIPFHLIINTTPDHLLAAAFRQQGGSCREGAYLMGKQQSDVYDKDDPQPYVYNLFGSVKTLDSLVLTQDQQMAFVQSVIQRESALPDSLAKELLPDKIYMFLGFDYENWYMRFLLHLLKLNDKMEMVFGLHDELCEPSTDSKIFFASQYKMAFVEMDDAAFLETTRQQLNGTPPPPAPAVEAKTLFCLCDREDEPLFRELDKQLAALKRRCHLRTISNLDLMAGDVTDDAIRRQIQSADLLLPIITSDLLASELYDTWMPEVLARHGNGAIVAPVLMRPCPWEEADWAKLPSILPRNHQPMSRWPSREEAFKHIAQEIENIIT